MCLTIGKVQCQAAMPMHMLWYGFLGEKLRFDELSLFQNLITPLSYSNSLLESITGKKARCKRNT